MFTQSLAVLTTIWGLLMGLAPLLQVRVIIRNRDAGGTSLGWVIILVRGHEKVPTGGQVEVPIGGQVEVPTLRVVS